MMRVRTLFARSARATAEYYGKYLAKDTHEIPGRWTGRQAPELVLVGDVSVDDLSDVLAGRTHFGRQVLAHVVAGSGQPPDPMATLSARERQIMRMVVTGMSSAAIGNELKLSPKTVDTYRSRLMAKLGVHDVANLVRLAVRLGVIDGDAP